MSTDLKSVNFVTWLQEPHPELSLTSIEAVLSLAADGATIPFMARYRKEQTGNLNEVAIQTILDGKEKWDQITDRQKFIINEIDKQKKLTPELKDKILQTFQMEVLDDIYLPYKQLRKTKAAAAKEAGLEPLAEWIWNCGHGIETPHDGQTLEIWAYTFRNEAKGINDAAAAIAGAQDILVERLSQIQELRQKVRDQVFQQGTLRTEKGAKAKPNSKFETYFDFREPIQSLLLPQNSHRYLAMRRGWMEEELTLSIQGPKGDPEDEPKFENQLIQAFETAACTVPESPGAAILQKAARLAYKAHVFLSIENEVHKTLREVADTAAIDVFAENLRKILLASPFGPKTVLGVDPGVRTGCKLALVSDSGAYLASSVMYLNNDAAKDKAKTLIGEIVKNTQLSAVAVGNGTAGRETETFLRLVFKELGVNIPVVVVSEAGASVYSASEVAREEFPDLDVTVRGAISIARRLQDPLAELVKVEPKSIGVGQYQHDVSPNLMKRSLTQVVEICVNQVGVNLNTASYSLLTYVSGIGPSLAKSLIEHRSATGLFQSREDLLKVPHFSKKAFQQAAGFLRIPNSENPLDHTAVHPENYSKLEATAARLGKTLKDLIGSQGIAVLKKDPELKNELGEFTFADLIKELEKPGRDPRDPFMAVAFRDDIFELKDLKPGMICPGVVTNVTNFGAFVDIGVHQDGLVHISQISEKFIKDPKEVVHPGLKVTVKVLEVNLEKSQISLTMKNAVEKPAAAKIAERAYEPRPHIRSHATAGPKGRPNTDRPLPVGHALNPKGKPGRPSPGAPVKKPREAFNNPFGGLANLRNHLKSN